jgi:hypothetical protein
MGERSRIRSQDEPDDAERQRSGRWLGIDEGGE